MTKPNVLLITIDTVRADMLGCYGHKSAVTPNLDRLANSGVLFEQAITGGSWTQAAFPALLTSTHASMYGGCLGPLALERPSPISALTECGYVTGGFTTSPLLGRSYGYQRGFINFTELNAGEIDPPLRRVKGGERLLRKDLTHKIAGKMGRNMRPARLYPSATTLTSEVCNWVTQVSQPFFVWAHYMDVHWPYHREELLDSPSEIAQAWRDMAELYRINRKGETITAAQRQRYIDLYEQALKYTDSEIGRLLDFLEESGILNNTIVIITSDHGEEFLERKRWGHFETNLHDEIVKVPLIFRGPEIASGKVVTSQVRLLDVMPTILDLCGVSPISQLEGMSLVSLWSQNGSPYSAKEAISERWRYEEQIVAIRTERYKYIWSSSQPERPQLFDLLLDPEENNDLSTQHPQELERFARLLEAHQQKVAQSTSSTSVDEPELDDAVLQRLQDLGYLD